jgi:hypothetical protein
MAFRIPTIATVAKEPIVLLFLIQIALALPPAATLSEDWARHQKHASKLPQFNIGLEQKDFAVLAKGEIVRKRLVLDGPDRAVGAVWSALPRDALWIAILDDAHTALVKGLHEERISGDPGGDKLLYQHLDLPWPFTDRQWVIAIQNDVPLLNATDGGVWSRTWHLADPATVPKPDPDAIWTPMIDGSWLLISAGGGTIAVYQVRTLIGGAIPMEAVTQWALRALDEMLNKMVLRAGEIPAHYDGEHTPFARPDGSVIAPY